MPQFSYIGRDYKGKQRKGKVQGANKREAVIKLRKKRIAVNDIKEIEESILNKEITIGQAVKFRDLVIYLRQFGTLLKAGVTVVNATNILARQTESKMLSTTLKEVEEDLRQGNSLSVSFSKHNKVFPPIIINMVYAGEVSGDLDGTLERLAVYYEKQHQTRQKVISALIYPAIVGIVAVIAVLFLLAFVVPTFADLLLQSGGELPTLTKFVLLVSEFVQSFWWLIILLFVLIVISFYIIRQNSSSKFYLDYVILKLPILGKITQKAAIARMTRTLSALFTSSVPVIQALSIVEKVVGNEVIAQVIQQLQQSLENGQRLADPLRNHWIFPPLVTQMIAIGEETGSLDAMLAKVADFYEDEVDNYSEQLKSLIEPVMIVFLAVIVGIIVIAIILPMFEIYNTI
jgi:type IV pilus assembly protein PilC